MRRLIVLSVFLCGACSSWAKLTDEHLYRQLKELNVQHPMIVLAQARLETGNYASQLCRERKNLFGIKANGRYKSFHSYKECILYYKDKIQSRYIGGDYYAFLKRIGYARDPAYIQKVKRIAENLKILS